MDRGAHFYKADFQIHTPRDGGWTNLGPDHARKAPPFTEEELRVLATRPITPSDRMIYARAFVRACQQRDLRAVAITDHNDICFIKYVQLASQGQDLTGFDPATFAPEPSKQNPVVFPGVELTLSVPCQAIVLLDASADVSLQSALLQTLGLAPLHPEAEAKGPEPVRLNFPTLIALDQRLRDNPNLRDRYIILPNFNYEGGDTIFREGLHQRYAEMPCVGGYTEKDYGRYTSGHHKIMNGLVDAYGGRAAGVFQTSDSRHADFRLLGCRATWVKMAEPTAEGLRQACLSRSSRLFQTEPRLPTRYISRVVVTRSEYLQPLDLRLNPQFNAFIGGRGTGKSTFLEFIRWTMQDQPVDVGAENGVDRKRQHFLDTLQKVGGVVGVHWSIDGTPHVVTFDPANRALRLSVGSEPERDATAEEVRALLPIRAYSQKQLSSVSGKRSELQRFVEEPIRDRLRGFENDFEAQRTAIRTNYTNRRRRRDLSAQAQLQQTQLASIQERVRTIQSSLKNLPADAEQAMLQHSARLVEQAYVTAAQEGLAGILSDLDHVGDQFNAPLRPALPDADTPQKDRLVNIQTQIDVRIEVLQKAVHAAKAAFQESLKTVDALFRDWATDQDRHVAVLALAQAQKQEDASSLGQLSQLRKDETSALSEIARLQKLLRDIPDGEAALPEAWAAWVELHSQRSTALTHQCASLSTQSGGRLFVELQSGRDVENALAVLRGKLQGAGISARAWDLIETHLTEGGLAVQRWLNLCNGLLTLLENTEAASPTASVPTELQFLELTPKMLSGIGGLLSFDGWLELATLTIQDVPSFYYTAGGHRIDFEKASAGQQATVLLTLLLKDSNGPLLIDQPEDDLDNDVIGDVIEEIRLAKLDRQLLFASHSANLVVNGDAELVVRFHSVSQDGRSRGAVGCEGAIDCRPVREAITDVMEGGKKAFELRRQKYGF